MDEQNLELNSSNSNKIEDQTRKQEELRLWCKALKITPEQFFAMPDEELKLRINNLKGRLRLKVAKNQIAQQKAILDNIMKNHNVSLETDRVRGGNSNGSRDDARQRGGVNIWDILCQVAAEECDCEDSGEITEADYEEEPCDATYDVTPTSCNSADYESYDYRENPVDSRFYDTFSDHEYESYDCDEIKISDSFQPIPALSSTPQCGPRGRQQHFRNYTDYEFELSGVNSETEGDNTRAGNCPPGCEPRNNTFTCPPGCEPSNPISNARSRLSSQNANQTNCAAQRTEPRNSTFNVLANRRNNQNVNQTCDTPRNVTFNAAQSRTNNLNANETYNAPQHNCRNGNATFNANRNSRSQNANQTFDAPGNAQNRQNGCQQIVCPPGCVPAPYNSSQNQVSNQNANQTFGVPPRNDPCNPTFNAAKNCRNSLGPTYEQSSGKNCRPSATSTMYREDNTSNWDNFKPQPTSTPARTSCPPCSSCPPNNRSMPTNQNNTQRRIQGRSQSNSNQDKRNC